MVTGWTKAQLARSIGWLLVEGTQGLALDSASVDNRDWSLRRRGLVDLDRSQRKGGYLKKCLRLDRGSDRCLDVGRCSNFDLRRLH